MAEQNSSDKIADALVRHQIRLIRLAAGTGSAMIKKLNSIEAELKRVLVQRVSRLTGPRVTFGKTTRKSVRAIVKALQNIQNPTWKEIEAGLRKELLIVAKMETAFTATVVEKALPVTVVITPVPPKNLIRLVFSDPIDDKNLNQWTKSVRFADRTRFVEEIQNGLIVGDTATEISKRLFGTIRQAGTDGVRQITRRNLQGLAQTTINGITNRARSELYARNRDVFSKEIFVATLDSRTTPVCRANDGKEFNIGEGATPPLHFNCRSLRVPKLAVQKLAKRPASGVSKKLLEGLKGPERRAKVAQLTGQVPAETTYSQFLKRQTKGFQAEVMGVKKAKLFREGGLNLDNFVNQAGNELNLRQLQLAHPEAFVRAGIKL